MEKMQIVIGEKTYNVSLYDNETVKSLKDMLPLTVSMEELNGNEKYTYLPQSLPTARVYPGTDLYRRFDALRFRLSGAVL